MNRRFHVQAITQGIIRLDPAQSRHLRDVLRIAEGEEVELFDGTGLTAPATVVTTQPLVELKVVQIQTAFAPATRLTIAAAPPKGPRADWLVEKLSELGVSAYIPLQTARTIVHPEEGKLQRWQRLATESAKQCKRADIMQILPPQNLEQLQRSPSYPSAARWVLSTDATSQAAIDVVSETAIPELLALIGPEGGWTENEERFLRDSGFVPIHLTSTILRIETAAIALASLVMIASAGNKEPQ